MKPSLEIIDHVATLKGQLTVKYHSEVSGLVQQINNSAAKSLLIDEPEELDLCCIQLLLSLSADRNTHCNPIRIGLALRDSDLKLLKSTGFSSLVTPSKDL